MGEDDAATVEFCFTVRQNFPMLPDEEIWALVDHLRELNDLYGVTLGG